MAEKKKCFVVMGFGEKTDLATGRTLDLDKTYRVIIKPAVESAGLECIRADTVVHSGVIDKPMYELLLSADLVIADLSTSNPNAIYELGVRHALRPYTTIVIAEKQFKFPFDLHSLLIRPYEHLGKGIDAEEAERVRTALAEAIRTLVSTPQPDSPVFTFLPELVAAQLRSLSGAAAAVASEIGAAVATGTAAAVRESEDIDSLLEQFKIARANSKWDEAITHLSRLLERRPSDVYLKQQLALATYKSKQPDPESALLKAHAILQTLDPHQTTDPESLGLWGGVHKRLWELKKARLENEHAGKEQLKANSQYLDEAIWAYEKGFFVKDDHWNAINHAYLLNERTSISDSRNALADTVLAERRRTRVVEVAEELLIKGIKTDSGQIDPDETFWVCASLVEAYTGLGRNDKAARLLATTVAEAPEEWMRETLEDQLKKLRARLGEAPLS